MNNFDLTESKIPSIIEEIIACIKVNLNNHDDTVDGYLRFIQNRVKIAEEVRIQKIILLDQSLDKTALWLYERCVKKRDIEDFLELPDGSLKAMISRKILKPQANNT